MQKYFPSLQKCPLFHSIPQEDMMVLFQCLGAKVRFYKKCETVLRMGEPAREIGVVLEGEIHIEQMDYQGKRSMVGHVGVNGIFGEAFSCAGIEELPVDVVAAKATEILWLDCRRITATCGNACVFHNQVLFNLLQIMARKNLFFHQKIQIMSRRTTREKLLAYLNWQAGEHGSNSFTIPYNRQELADFLEVDRSGLSTEIGKLCRENVLECKRNFFHIL